METYRPRRLQPQERLDAGLDGSGPLRGAVGRDLTVDVGDVAHAFLEAEAERAGTEAVALGESDATYVKIRFSEDEEPLQPVVWLKRIPAGSRVAFTETFTVSSLTPSIEVLVDPFREYVELSKDNNRLVANLTLESAHF